MKEPVLVIMAAGMGSRYGGLKQIDPINEDGDIIIDYSIYDAIRAGFKRLVFVIRREHEADFRRIIGDRVSKFIKVDYAFQDLKNIPEGFNVPEDRIKPWGTGQAILSCRDIIDEPFAVINSDDYYGAEAFKLAYDFLTGGEDGDKYRYAMVGYLVENTLTDKGYVSRGVCSVNEEGILTSITERTHIEKTAEGQAYLDDKGNYINIPTGTVVSMNLWAFTNSYMKELDKRFAPFLKKAVKEDPLKAEYLLPTIVSDIIAEGLAEVTVLKTSEQWYGVTYKEDKEKVREALQRMKDEGKYNQHLWQ